MDNLILENNKIKPNLKQQECIDSLEGPVMVLAGPGTGKTFTLIHRIKAMLEEKNISPKNILCMTFSEPAASEMKERVIKVTGKSASSIEINTYHAFCNNLIKQYPSKFELLENVSVIDDVSKVNLMKLCLDEFKPKFLVDKWNNRYHYLKQLLSCVDDIKKNQLTKEQFFSNMKNNPEWLLKSKELEEEKEDRINNNKALKTFLSGKYEPHIKKIEKAKEAWEIIELYMKCMAQKNFIDFNDMINLVVETFENDFDFLTKVAAGYKYLMIDEYQDTNHLQNKLIDLIAQGAGTDNIFVVGDDDQIIFEFQGAKSDNLEQFLLKYPNTKVICLDENNRSTQSILDLSYKIISQDATRLENNPKFSSFNISKRLTAKNSEINKLDKKVSLKVYADKLQENNHIVETIKDIINSDKCPKNKEGEKDLSQFAVLCRKNTYLSEFAALFEAQNINYQLKTTKSIFEIKSTILIYFYLKLLDNYVKAKDKPFALLLSKPFDFELEDYNFLLEQNKPYKKDFITIIRENISREWKNKEKVTGFLNTFDELKELKYKKNLKDFILEIVNRTGILAYYTNPVNDVSENLLAIKRLLEEAASYSNLYKPATLSGFINHLDSALNDNIEINIDKDTHIRNAVQLLTFHSSKGREFEYVFMPNLTSSNWEKKRPPNKIELPLTPDSPDDKELLKNAELLKLMFVGITRAKHTLYLSYPIAADSTPYTLTMFLSELKDTDDVLEYVEFPKENFNYHQELLKTMQKEEFNYHLAFENELKERLKDFVLSAHSFKTYKNCPRKFLYSELYKIPVVDRDSKMFYFGSAIHKTLEWMINSAIEQGIYPQKEIVLEMFDKKLSLFEFDSEEKFEEYIERGHSALESYYHKLIATPIKNIVEIEAKFDGITISDYPVKGFIDRVEENEDGSYSIYDYKTGSAKYKTSVAPGKDYEHYYDQLRFYKLAFEAKNEAKIVSNVGLIFIEESDKSFNLQITKEEDEDMKNQIIQVLNDIHSLKFKPEDYKNNSSKSCENCDFKMICKLNVI